MELGQRLKEYRSAAGMTQEELAEKMYVSRQTISSWENDKSYPDIHSLLMLSDLFGVTLDTFVKGDIEIMKEKVDQTDIRNFKRESNIFGVLVVLCVVSPLLLFKGLGIPGLLIWAVLFCVMMFFGIRLEKVKKEQDIHTYREIVAFMSGVKLDGIEKAREEGKRYYQKIILCLISGIAALIVSMIILAVL